MRGNARIMKDFHINPEKQGSAQDCATPPSNSLGGSLNS
jgi:hypothetical protein